MKAGNQKLKSSKGRFLLSGGGTGGHIFPAIAIAEELRIQFPDCEILFIGAEGKMEMQKVPQAGFDIQALPISGFNRSNLLSNIKLPIKIVASAWKSSKIISDFKPDFAVGTGGYASGPALWMASQKKVPYAIQEQNAFPGKTNVALAKHADIIFSAFPDMEAYFAKEKTIFSGNPIRKAFLGDKPSQKEAKVALGFDPEKPLIFSFGGSQGSRAINDGWNAGADQLVQEDIQLYWQVGVQDWEKYRQSLWKKTRGIHMTEFIEDMVLAYAAADLVVSRAGAIAISEMAVMEKSSILIPLPTAAEDHQTKNAEALVQKNAAVMVKNENIASELVLKSIELLHSSEAIKSMEQAIKNFAKPDAAKQIVSEIAARL